MKKEASAEFGTYDFETYEWTKPLCFAMYWREKLDEHWVGPNRFVDSHDFYINRDSPTDVALCALKMMIFVTGNGGPSVWWAHNGGKFDALFILDAIKRLPGATAEGIVAGGRLIALKIHHEGITITLKDSYAVVQSKLSKALEDFEIPCKKSFTEAEYRLLEEDSRGMLKHSDARLEHGAIADCEALHALLTVVGNMFVDWGGKLKSTFSASALSVVKSEIDIPSHAGRQDLNSLCRNAYCGGRVEVFNHIPGVWLREYDVTSSYPWSMAKRLPWVLEGKLDGLSTSAEHLSICYATVDVPKQYIPPLPYTPVDGGLFFPWGKWSAWFTQAELEYANQNCGVAIQVHHSVCYRAAAPFTDYISKLFEDKRRATGARRSFDKLCLNGSYGKLAQRPESKLLRIFQSGKEGRQYAREATPGTIDVLADDYTALSESRTQWSPHTHYAAASFITGYSRILLHSLFVKAEHLAYGDTDSVHCQRTAALETGNGEELGGLKVELDDYTAQFYAPKLYVLSPRNGEPFYASKGFPVNATDFGHVVKGEQVGKRRMQTAKEQLKSRNKRNEMPRAVQEEMEALMLEPFENLKRWSGHSNKRKAHPSGSTEPWNVDDLIEGRHLGQLSPLANR